MVRLGADGLLENPFGEEPEKLLITHFQKFTADQLRMLPQAGRGQLHAQRSKRKAEGGTFDKNLLLMGRV